MSRKAPTEESYQVPLWIITFSDMTTNLLTFFVLLLSMGHMRDETLFDQGQALTYLESVRRGFGLKKTFDFGNIKVKYHTSERDDLPDPRMIDAREEDIRRIFAKLCRSMKMMSSPVAPPHTDFLMTDIRFGQGQAALNERAQASLRRLARHVQETGGSEQGTIYVLGLAGDGMTEQDQWLLSARRARAAAEFLERTLSAASGLRRQHSLLRNPFQWTVYSWGVGPGGDWAGPNSPISGQSQILIAVLRGNG